MSFLGGRTRKVTTYGKKQTRIISVHADLSPTRTTPPVSTSKMATPPRPPRMKKLSGDQACREPLTPLKATRVNVPKTPHTGLKQAGAPALKTPRGASDDPTLRQHVAKSAVRRRSVGSPRRADPPASHHSICKARGPLTPPRPVRGERNVEIEIVSSRLRHVSLDELSSSETALRSLLTCSTTKKIVPFSEAFTTPDFAKLLPSSMPPTVTKVGEASYSEVFSVGEGDCAVVVKVVPLLGKASYSTRGKAAASLPDCSAIPDVVREIEITRRMSQTPGGGFVEFLGAFVVEGAYPALLLDEWDTYRDEQGTESVRPDSFSSLQKYALIVLGNGGEDLESYRFENTRGWVQAAAVFWQVADGLARAETWTEFEHRDLHEGQILINDVEADPPAPIADYLDTRSTGVRATIIDFGLSRLDMPDQGAVYSTLPEEVYEGVGDQWDVYREQRDVVEAAGTWESFHPSTNVLWLHYLVGHLIHSTPTLRKPYARRGRRVAPKTPAQVRTELVRTRAEDAWAMLQEVLKALSKPSHDSKALDFSSAQNVMTWGRQQGWVL
ncbi:hypothetical protein CspeluHIS016_0103320 [Cutaneotrichosporon spelunceum]|uniref:non-specific serine/threonine protein kinase n=1 Tax=Cutaneotrichosporon spelunceum TaxID=1672016 RepID=A0AAD3TNU4_9TREE|nr:hypothetical protein CspeluHIS016_0103320 [Cutaneotrichosporon spelunceum]